MTNIHFRYIISITITFCFLSANNNKYAIIFDSSSDLIMLYSNPNLDKSDKILEILGY